MKLKQTYRQKLLFNFLVLFFAFAGVIAFVQYQRERTYKRDMLETQLEAWTDAAARAVRLNGLENDSASLARLEFIMPKAMRITVFTTEGHAHYDTYLNDYSLLDESFNAEEMVEARKEGKGSSIRYPLRNDKIHYFFAKNYDTFYVRTTLPYDSDLKHLLKADNYFSLFLFLLFPFVLVSVIYTSNRTNKSLQGLRRFVEGANNGEPDYDIEFPETDLGEVGHHIVKKYKELDEAHELLKQEKERGDGMARNVTHEVRTPVASVRGYIETLLQYPDLPKEKREHFLERAEKQIVRLTDLIDDLALISKTKDAPQMLQREEVDLHAVAADVEEEMRDKLKENNVECVNLLPEGTTLIGNYTLLHAIFKNLAENTVRYAGRDIRCCATLLPSDDDAYYHLSIYDTGVGVAEEHLPKMFDRFFRPDKGRSQALGGTGLGLSIVKYAVLFHGGTIEARNREGGGLEYRFTLKR